MAKRFGTILHIGLSKTAITMLSTSGWLALRSEVLADCPLSEEEAASPALLAAKLRSVLEDSQCAYMRTRIVLADSWVRSWMVTPPQNAMRLSDCQAAAAARFHALYSESMSDWQIAADWDVKQPFLACAMPRALLLALNQVMTECKLVLVEIAPQFVVVWNRWKNELKAGSWLATLYENVLTIAVVGQRHLNAVRSITLPPEAMIDQSCLPIILAREALRLNLQMPSEIHFGGQIPRHWSMHKVGSTKYMRLGEHPQETGSPVHAGILLAASGIRP